MKVELLNLTKDAQKLIEKAGRTSYLSYNKIDNGSYFPFIRMLIEKGHESVLEHASASFKISEVSRSLTHQLVRHRIASFTQQSQRHVDEKSFEYVVPESIKQDKSCLFIYENLCEEARFCYKALQNHGVPWEDARFVLPNATHTEIVITANLREWRHIIKLRTSDAAQWEIKDVMNEILRILKNKCPAVFYDFEVKNS